MERFIPSALMVSAALTAVVNAFGGPENVSLGKPVSVTAGSVSGAAPSSLTDGTFLPASTYWLDGTVAWAGLLPTMEIDLQGQFVLTGLIVQSDNNDSYRLSYLDESRSWRVLWVVPAVSGWGMQTRPNASDNSERLTLQPPVVASRLRLEANGGDDAYSMSEVQAFGVERSADCNGDGMVDYGQIADGTLADTNSDGVPDVCDCNGDGIADFGQVLSGELSDVNSNGVPDTCECLADLTGDGVVNGGDLSIVLGFWGTPAKTLPAADLNRDGIVDAADLAAILGSWGPCS